VDSMFSDYEALCAAVKSPLEFRARWEALLNKRVVQPHMFDIAQATHLKGHLPHEEEGRPIWERAWRFFDCRGLYVWGAWTGDAARVQYIGIADTESIGDRFSHRYADELAVARSHGHILRGRKESFCIGTKADVESYRRDGVPVKDGKTTRPARSERYAKLGLNNLWYFLLPASALSETQTKEDRDTLINVEGLLIETTSILLWEHFARKPEWSFPLLNRTHVTGRRFLKKSSQREDYNQWLRHGKWWPYMDRLMGLA
jgi:hypothetical protein